MDPIEEKYLEQLCEDPEGRFSFSDVLWIVAKVLQVNEEGTSQLFARLKHFQRLGIPSERPKRGTKTFYNYLQIIELVTCFQFVESGVEPGIIAEIIKNKENNSIGSQIDLYMLVEWVQIIENEGKFKSVHDWKYIWFQPSLMSSRWRDSDDDIIHILHHGQFEELCENSKWGESARILIFNVSIIAWRIYNACLDLYRNEHI